MGNVPGQYKEIVAEAIDIFKNDRFDKESFFLHMHADPFGAAADTTRYMVGGDGHMSTVHEKGLQRLQLFLHPVDPAFQQGDLFIFQDRYLQFGFFVRDRRPGKPRW